MIFDATLRLEMLGAMGRGADACQSSQAGECFGREYELLLLYLKNGAASAICGVLTVFSKCCEATKKPATLGNVRVLRRCDSLFFGLPGGARTPDL